MFEFDFDGHLIGSALEALLVVEPDMFAVIPAALSLFDERDLLDAGS